MCSYLKQKSLFFSKTENRKVKQVMSGNWYQCGRGGYKEKVEGGEYGGILCTHV
jgi:hypothetical protein